MSNKKKQVDKKVDIENVKEVRAIKTLTVEDDKGMDREATFEGKTYPIIKEKGFDYIDIGINYEGGIGMGVFLTKGADPYEFDQEFFDEYFEVVK